MRRFGGLESTLILSGRIASDGSEIIYQVSLVEVPEVECDLGPVQTDAGIEPPDQLVQAVPANYPLGRDADIIAEDALKRALADAGAVRQGIHSEDFRNFQYASDQLINLGNRWVWCREDGAQPAASGLDEWGFA